MVVADQSANIFRPADAARSVHGGHGALVVAGYGANRILAGHRSVADSQRRNPGPAAQAAKQPHISR